jgi:hypothetical protein
MNHTSLLNQVYPTAKRKEDQNKLFKFFVIVFLFVTLLFGAVQQLSKEIEQLKAR